MRRISLLVVLTSSVLLPPSALAHTFSFVDALLVLKSDETFLVDVALNLDALALGLPVDTDPQATQEAMQAMSPEERENAVESTRAMLLKRVNVRVDDQLTALTLTFPEYGTPLATESEHPTVLGVTARFAGRYVAYAESIRLSVSRALGPVHLTVFEQHTGRSVWYVLGPGEEPPPFKPPSESQAAAAVVADGGVHRCALGDACPVDAWHRRAFSTNRRTTDRRVDRVRGHRESTDR
jgi:hypothetical protein